MNNNGHLPMLGGKPVCLELCTDIHFNGGKLIKMTAIMK